MCGGASCLPLSQASNDITGIKSGGTGSTRASSTRKGRLLKGQKTVSSCVFCVLIESNLFWFLDLEASQLEEEEEVKEEEEEEEEEEEDEEDVEGMIGEAAKEE